MQVKYPIPQFSKEEAAAICTEYYGIAGTFHDLPSERDQNFHVRAEKGEFVLKFSNVLEDRRWLEFQNAAMERVAERAPEVRISGVCRSLSGESIIEVNSDQGLHSARLLTYVPGRILAQIHPISSRLRVSLGSILGSIDRALIGFDHPAAHRELKWDVMRVSWIHDYLSYIKDSNMRASVDRVLKDFEDRDFSKLRASIIYNDANDYNVLVNDDGTEVIGIIDFGDMVHTRTICELAVAVPYAIFGCPDPLTAAGEILCGYYQVFPLQQEELESLFVLIKARLCISIVNAAYQREVEPDNLYLTVTEDAAWKLLQQLDTINADLAYYRFRHACGDALALLPTVDVSHSPLSSEEVLQLRSQHLSRALSISYIEPLHIVRGWMQFLFDASGRRYLDAVNNVAHVGHCHPKVVKAAQRQIAILNTNTRYLHENLSLYARRLASLLPEPLSICFFVNSGSEANELAVRLAKTFANAKDMIVLEGGYHGNTNTLIDLSSYKFDGPGGSGAPEWVHKIPLADTFRGRFRKDDPDASGRYAECVLQAIDQVQQSGRKLCGFLHETMPSTAGQIVFPPEYLKKAYRYVHDAGGLCIADEVQTGFGRLGSHFWGFETQGVIPDIVTLGKPIGNGHPLGAVVTTPKIAEGFLNGMEFFSTFGGNPVSCAVGMAVLDVIEQEHLQKNALDVGSFLLQELAALKEKYPLIGDVRGMGLYIGVELVSDSALTPAVEEASYVVNRMRECGILISTDGIHHNVLKIRPPLVFTKNDADFLLATLNHVLKEDSATRGCS